MKNKICAIPPSSLLAVVILNLAILALPALAGNQEGRGVVTAERKFEAAILINKRDIAAYKKLAKIYLSVDRFEDADSLLKRGLKKARRKDDKLDVWALAIESKLSQNDVSAARRYLKRAETEHRSRSHGVFTLAKIRLSVYREKFSRAREMLTLVDQAALKSRAVTMQDYITRSEAANRLSEVSWRFSNQLTRAELAELLVEDLGLSAWVEKSSRKVKSATDLGKPNKNIDAVLAMGLRGLKVIDGRFYPEEKIDRMALALIIEDLLYKTQGVSRTRFIGSETPFEDLKSSHTGFNAMMTLVSRGYLSASADGKIEPDKNVTAGQAIVMLNKLQASINAKTNLGN